MFKEATGCHCSKTAEYCYVKDYKWGTDRNLRNKTCLQANEDIF